MTGAEPLIELLGLSKRYPLRGARRRSGAAEVRAVEELDLRIGRGETVALVGESGCGKSTVGRCLLRLVEPSAGQGLYWPAPGADPVDLFQLGPGRLRALRRDLQILFQDPELSLNPRMRVGVGIEEALRVHRRALGGEAARCSELLGMVGLEPEVASRYPHQLSGGQLQRVAIARALSVEPKLLVCDEALSALDVSVRAQILELLARLKRELGLAYLFLSHDLAVVRHLADRVAVLYLGRIVEQGPADQIFRAPQHPYTRALLSAVPRLDPGARVAAEVLGGEVPSAAAPPSGCAFHPRCSLAEERCRTQAPQLREAGLGQRAACHLVPPPT